MKNNIIGTVVSSVVTAVVAVGVMKHYDELEGAVVKGFKKVKSLIFKKEEAEKTEE